MAPTPPTWHHYREIQDYIYESYQPGHYQLSNGKYLRIPNAYQNYQKHINKWLKILQLPPEILAVIYRGETYYLPA